MRACLVAHRVYDSNTHMRQFAQALARRGDQVDVLSLRAWDLPTHDVIDGVSVTRWLHRTVKERGRLSYVASIAAFMARAAVSLTLRHLRNPYQVIHVQAVPDFLVFAALIPRLLGARVILDLRDLTPEFYASKYGARQRSWICRLLRLAERASARVADHVIVASPLWIDRVAGRSAPRGRCTMIWYSPDPAVWHPRASRRQDGKFVILYPGTLNWHQGVDVAIRAFPLILMHISNAELHIRGNGADRPRLEQLARELGVESSVRFFDPVPVNQVVEVMAACDLGIVPKRAAGGFGDEAASTKIWEFMALGVPVVASRTRIESEFFDDRHIRFFESENETSLAEAVISVWRDPALRRRLVQNGLDYIRGDGREHPLAAYLRLVDQLGERSGPRRPSRVPQTANPRDSYPSD